MRALPLLSTILFLGAVALTGCKTDDVPTADDILANLDRHLGKRVTFKTKLRSGARCRVGEQGEFKTYCGDCQYCRGPVVVDTALKTKEEGLDDWPMILAGAHAGQDIRCKGPLNEVECHPFDLDKTYVIRGRLENQHPPRLIVQEFWEADPDS
ncbi:MAG: hypothetical protein RMA76_31330 [Deltaproteobacteria bacterium]